MGRVGSIGLTRLVQEFTLDTFVETGTGWGLSVEDALMIPALTDVRSIEIDRETYLRNAEKFLDWARVRLYRGDSRIELWFIIDALKASARVLWYLDAHFPGSGRAVPTQMLPLTTSAEDAVPLAGEVIQLLGRNLQNDVIVIDDLCMFEPGLFEAGNDSSYREVLQSKAITTLEKALADSHNFTRVTKDNGYLICTPRRVS